MINRTKLEHILEYARQQKRFGQHCKIPPGDMVEIVEIAMRKAGNPPVIPDGWISCSERMPEKYDFDIWVFSPSKGVLDGLQWDGSMFTDDEYQFVIHDATHWMRKAYPAAPQQDGE
ncbi:TPA: DUF551 domain-containing protein [Escherichia coli]|uniref:DUF551 domain-containing protein n=1 Tax=Escherichia coli TaxID=562 RepID=UPI000BE5A922|nr:DUF551 domain-containing protein [Escherichia coli]EFB3645610.1 DUF551 domain-containing protein [Escherichia coli]HAX4512285.1 DUF551 domain-containing protein [Escherichia coli]